MSEIWLNPIPLTHLVLTEGETNRGIRQVWGPTGDFKQDSSEANRLLCMWTVCLNKEQQTCFNILYSSSLTLDQYKKQNRTKWCKMMISESDSLPLLFLTKLLIDAHLTRKLPTQQYDLRQSVSAYLKSTGDQEESCIMVTWLAVLLWESTLK